MAVLLGNGAGGRKRRRRARGIHKEGLDFVGPFNFPWMTFMAFVVTGASVVAALVWALRKRARDE